MDDFLDKEHISIQIVQDFPLMASWKFFKYWSGFIVVKGVLVRVAIEVPNFPSADGASIEGDKDSQSLLAAKSSDIQTALDCKGSVYDLLKRLQIILDKEIEENKDESKTAFDAHFYTNLLSELELIGLQKIEHVAADFREVHTKHFDSTGRKHILKFMLPSRYPHSNAKVIDELPCTATDTIIWPLRIYDAYTHFTTMVEQYILFWAEMDDINEKLRVIDPQQPNLSHTHRRILINEKNILHIVLNPLKPRCMPEFVFSGPDMEEFTNLVDKNYVNWDDSFSVIENLQSILCCDFMPKEDMVSGADGNADELTCTICYVYNLEDEIPDTTCDCGSAFHASCLYELFLNECSKKVGLRRCVDCPVCDAEIKVSTVQQSNW